MLLRLYIGRRVTISSTTAPRYLQDEMSELHGMHACSEAQLEQDMVKLEAAYSF